MDYKLKKAKLKDKKILCNYKILNILDFDKMSQIEKKKVNNYINNATINHLEDYRLIIVDNKVVGSYCSYIKDDYIFFDEIYLEKEYRNLGIGTKILTKEIKTANYERKNIKLWVYKENEKAVDLYERLGFTVELETETRYLMKK